MKIIFDPSDGPRIVSTMKTLGPGDVVYFIPGLYELKCVVIPEGVSVIGAIGDQCDNSQTLQDETL